MRVRDVLRPVPTAARQDLLIVGVGNPVRGDDRAGLEVVRRLQRVLGPSLQALETQEPDIVLAERFASFSEVVIVDAMRILEPLEPEELRPSGKGGRFRVVGLEPADSGETSGGFISHVFDWRLIITLARDVFGGSPKTWLMGIRAFSFEFSEELSPACAECAEAALTFLTGYCQGRAECSLLSSGLDHFASGRRER